MIDTRGYSCPTPVILVQKAVKSGAPAELEVLANAMVAVENITRYARSQGYTTTVTPDGEDYRLTLKKYTRSAAGAKAPAALFQVFFPFRRAISP